MRRQRVGGILLSAILVVSMIALGAGPGMVAADATVEEDVEEVNEDHIPVVNTLVEELNSELEHADEVEKTDPVEAETRAEAEAEADRLRDEIDRYPDDILGAVVTEINTESQNMIGQDIVEEPVETSDDAREVADDIEEEWGELAEEAYEGLREAADGLDQGESALESAIFILEGGAVGSIAGGPIEDADTGEPLEGVTVEIEDGAVTQSDEDGMFELNGVPEGEHTLIVHGDEEYTETVEVSEDEQSTAVEGVTLEVEEGDSGGDELLFGSTLLDIGSALAILILLIGIGFAAAGGLTHSREDMDTLDIEPLDLSLTAEDFKSTGKAVGFFAVAGIGLGITAYFVVGWAIVAFAHDVIPVGDLAQIVSLTLVAVVAPALAITYGAIEGTTSPSRERAARTMIAALVGTVLLVLFALVLVNFASTGEEVEASMWRAIGIAGIVGVISAIASSVGLKLRSTMSS